MKGLFKRWTALILIGGILIQLLAGCSGNRSLPKSSDTRFQEKVISEQIITESGIAEEKLDESYIIENLVYEEGVYEYKISEDIISQAYTTDDFGRIIKADFADLKLKNPERRFRLDILDSKQNIGKGFELTTDDRGHLIADMFDGNNTMANIVAMNSSVNQREVQAIENIWKLCLQDGGHVHGSIEPTYTGESFRPDSFKYIYDAGKGEISETIINSIS